jgi:hypothetical protein
MLVFAAVLLWIGWSHAIQWATLLAVAAYIHARWLPWQFFVGDDGILLKFPFGRRLFLSKAALTVRMEYVGAFALVGRTRRFGYPLLDRILYEPGRGEALERALSERGYTVVT